MKHHKQIINKLKVTRDILFCIVFLFIIVILFRYREQHRFLSPCSDSGCHVNTLVVYAADDDSELQKIVHYIVEKFEPEGRNEAVWALGCFISESKLNPEAYNYNKNKTWDFGIAQWNQVHGQSIDEIRDWKTQIDLAYGLYKKRGHSPWYGRGCH